MDLGIEGGFNVFYKEVNPSIHPDWCHETNNGITKLPRTSFQTVFANDIKPDAQSAWLNYFSKRGLPSSDIYKLESIVNLVKAHDAGDHSIFPSDIDVVTGGFPCQDFSVAGKRQGFNSSKSHDGHKLSDEEIDACVETRGQLYIWMKNVIEICKPKMFIAENVKGLVNLADVKDIIEHDFRHAADQGYLVVPARVLMAADYGVPQSRQRVIFIGFNKSAMHPKAIEALSKETIPAE